MTRLERIPPKYRECPCGRIVRRGDDCWHPPGEPPRDTGGITDPLSQPGRWILELPGDLPLLNLNQRRHWSHRHKAAKQWRNHAAVAVWAARIPPLGRCHVTLTCTPPDRRRRDRHNLVPNLKHAVDGVVDAGVIPDDTPDHLVTDKVVLAKPDGVRRWRFHLMIEQETQ